MAGPRTTPLPPELLAELAAGPPRIAELVAGVSAAGLKAVPQPGERSVVEILAHLRACGDVWGGHIAAILAEENPVRRGVNPRHWIRDKNYASQPFATSFLAYEAQRTKLVELLRPLPKEAWTRIATIVGEGTPLTFEVRFYANQLFEYERALLGQIARAVAAVLGRA